MSARGQSGGVRQQLESASKPLACRTMSQEAKPPRLVVPITLALCTGTLACIGSSRDAQILGVVGFCLGLVFTLSLPPVVARCAVRPGTKKIVLVLVGFLILVGACYIIARLDASLRTHGLLWGEANRYAPRNGTGKHLWPGLHRIRAVPTDPTDCSKQGTVCLPRAGIFAHSSTDLHKGSIRI